MNTWSLCLSILSNVAYDLDSSPIKGHENTFERLQISLTIAKKVFPDLQELQTFQVHSFSDYGVGLCDDEKKIVVISFKGSTFTKMKDIYNDLWIIFRNKPSGKCLEDSEKLVNSMLSIKKEHKFYLTGHSLGGLIGSILAEKYLLSCETFNSGSTPFSWMKKSKAKTDSKEEKFTIVHHRFKGDKLFIGKITDENTVVYPEGGHELKYFTGIDFYFSRHAIKAELSMS